MDDFDSSGEMAPKPWKAKGGALAGVLGGIVLAGVLSLVPGAVGGAKMAFGAAQIEGVLFSALVASCGVAGSFASVSGRRKWRGCLAASAISALLWIGSELLWRKTGVDLTEVGAKALALGIAGWFSVGLSLLADGEFGGGGRRGEPAIEVLLEARNYPANGLAHAPREDSGEAMLDRQGESAKKIGERAVYRARMSVAKRKAQDDRVETDSEIEYVSPEALRLAREAIERASSSAKR